MWNGMNRRRFPRVNYRCIITLRNFDEALQAAPRIITTHTENLGMGGICVVLGVNIDLFKYVDIELMLEDGGLPVRCSGCVVWVVKKTDPINKGRIMYDTGIEFLNIKDTEKTRIGNIVEKILSP